MRNSHLGWTNYCITYLPAALEDYCNAVIFLFNFCRVNTKGLVESRIEVFTYLPHLLEP